MHHPTDRIAHTTAFVCLCVVCIYLFVFVCNCLFCFVVVFIYLFVCCCCLKTYNMPTLKYNHEQATSRLLVFSVIVAIPGGSEM